MPLLQLLRLLLVFLFNLLLPGIIRLLLRHALMFLVLPLLQLLPFLILFLLQLLLLLLIFLVQLLVATAVVARTLALRDVLRVHNTRWWISSISVAATW